MRVAALFDIHGNLPALEAVLRDVASAEADLVVVGGDVLPGPMPQECLDVLDTCPLAVRYIRGNGECETLAAADGLELTTVPPPYRPAIEWGARQLSTRAIARVREWPLTIELDVADLGRVLFCHATPDSDSAILTRLTPDQALAQAFEGVSVPLVVCGHTHMTFDRQVGPRRVVNAGSVGMPFGSPGADWLLIEPGGPSAMHTDYDLEAAAARIRVSGYPGAGAFAANHVLHPPSEEAMLAVFERR